MSIDEAIKYLDGYFKLFESTCEPKLHNSMTMAIEALKFQEEYHKKYCELCDMAANEFKEQTDFYIKVQKCIERMNYSLDYNKDKMKKSQGYAKETFGILCDTWELAIKIINEEMVIDLIKNQPKVGEWIPCSERLPEINKRVLACNDVGSIMTGLVYRDDIEKNIICSLGSHVIYDVIAWQPLPEPYVLGGQEPHEA